MSLQLTDEEVKKIKGNRKNDSELPVYYDANLQVDVPISRDFESYLLITPDELKTSATQWIGDVVGLQSTNKDRDELVALAFGQEKINSQAKMDSIDSTLSNFNEFRTNFQTDVRFAEIPELQKLLFDLQRVVEELTAARERAEFDNVVCQVIERGNDRLTITEPQIEQLQSWSGVLSAYLKG